MKKGLLIISIAMLLIQCSLKVIPLKNTYQTKPYEAVSENNKDSVWDKIIDFFAQGGIPIKLIDRSSGLIISESARVTATYEDKNGKLNNPNAYIVMNKIYDPGTRKYITSNVGVSGEWNIRIKTIDGHKTNVNVNFVNVKYGSLFENGLTPSQKKFLNQFEIQSTGKFEEKIFNIIK